MSAVLETVAIEVCVARRADCCSFDILSVTARLRRCDMDIMLKCCAGLDVHQKNVWACVRKVGAGNRITREIRCFETMTENLLELAEWLKAHEVTRVAM